MRSVGNYTHSVTSSQTQALRRNIKGFNRIWPFTGCKAKLWDELKFTGLRYTVKSYGASTLQC